MVDRIRKIETDPLRLVRKDDAGEEKQGQQQQEDHQEEHDEFSQKLDFEKWTGDTTKNASTGPSLWEPKLSAPTSDETKAKPTEDTARQAIVSEDDEPTESASITFFRAAGLFDLRGDPQWVTIGLYSLALLGFLLTVIFVVNALL